METGKVVPPSMITPRAIREAHAWDARPRHSPSHPGMVGVAAPHHIGHAQPERRVPRHHLDFLVLCELPEQLLSLAHRSVRRLTVRLFPDRQKLVRET